MADFNDYLPPPKTAAEFHERARCIGALHKFSVSSGGRTAQRNADPDIKGNPNSWHLWSRGALAYDMYPHPSLPASVKEEQLENAATDARVLGMDAVVYPGHLHIEPSDG